MKTVTCVGRAVRDGLACWPPGVGGDAVTSLRTAARFAPECRQSPASTSTGTPPCLSSHRGDDGCRGLPRNLGCSPPPRTRRPMDVLAAEIHRCLVSPPQGLCFVCVRASPVPLDIPRELKADPINRGLSTCATPVPSSGRSPHRPSDLVVFKPCLLFALDPRRRFRRPNSPSRTGRQGRCAPAKEGAMSSKRQDERNCCGLHDADSRRPARVETPGTVEDFNELEFRRRDQTTELALTTAWFGGLFALLLMERHHEAVAWGLASSYLQCRRKWPRGG